MKRKTVKLTLKQAELIEWACFAGLEQHEKFIRHDDWDHGMSKKERYEEMWADRKFLKAIKTMREAIGRSKNEKD